MCQWKMNSILHLWIKAVLFYIVPKTSWLIERVTCFETSWWSIDVFPGITDRLLDSRFPRAVLPEDQKWGPGTQDQIRHSLPRIHPWSIRFQLQQVLIWMDRTDFEPIMPVFCTWQFLMLIFTWHHCMQITVYALCKITFFATKWLFLLQLLRLLQRVD